MKYKNLEKIYLIKNGLFSSKGQVSLEYLLIVTAFFSILLIILPVAFNTMNSFLFANDDLLAKSIVNELKENISLMNFLGDGTVRVFDYSPSKGMTIYSMGSKVIILTELNSFEVETSSTQLIQKIFFDSKFFITLKKSNGLVEVSVN